MPEVSKTAYDMISGMTPEVQPGVFVFASVDDPNLVASLVGEAISIFKEAEGVSMIIPAELAEKAGLKADHPMLWITLGVYSALDGVGLTSAVSAALGENAIPCNMVAAFNHDHVFVPSEMGDRAMQILTSLQSQVTKNT